MIEITFKEVFDKSKDEPRLQALVGQAFVTSIEMSLRAKERLGFKADAGDLMLNALSTIAGLEGFALTNREEITAEYMAEILNSHNKKHNEIKKRCGSLIEQIERDKVQAGENAVIENLKKLGM